MRRTLALGDAHFAAALLGRRSIAERRAAIADRIAGLRELHARLTGLEVRLQSGRPQLRVLGDGACCDAAASVVGTAEGTCPCCASAPLVT